MVPSVKDLFGGAAPYYAKYRADYGDAAIDALARAFGADSTVLDLGCGPGTVAIPLARRVREVIAADPDEEMLAEGRRLGAGASNIRWLAGDSTRLRELHRVRDEFGVNTFSASNSFQATGEHHDDVLRDSPFSDLESSLYEHRRVYDLEAVLGLQLSLSYTAPARLGDRLPAFVEAARAALLAGHPSGRWEQVIVTEVLIARRAGRST
jgi:SAM-dependent methyltransferase